MRQLRATALRRYLPGVFVFALVASLTATGAFRSLENDLADTRFRLLQRPSLEHVAVVAIDSQSLRQLPSWPWPRRHYATVLDALFAAGASRVVLDIDFSSNSNPPDDAALEAALERHGERTFLPVFQQVVRDRSGERSLQTTRPLDRFRRHVQLAGINVMPAADGLIRDYAPLSHVGDEIYPSTGFTLANPVGVTGPFTIDFAIDPATVPHLSFADILAGTFSPADIAGRSLIIGATAVELGDRHAVPVWRNIAGPTLTALAAEAMVENRALQKIGTLPTLAITLAIALILTPRLANWSWRRGGAVVLGAMGGTFTGTVALQAAIPVMVTVVPPLMTILLAYVVGLAASLDRQTLRLVVESLTAVHRRALLDRIVQQSDDGILILAPNGKVDLANPATYRILGRDDRDPLPPIDTLFTADNAHDRLQLHLLATGDPAAADRRLHEFTVANSPETETTVEVLVSEVRVEVAPANRRRGTNALPSRNLVCTIRDVSERKRLETVKRQFMEESLRIAKAKSSFFANMNHELRTPLNCIIGYAEMLHSGAFGKLSDKQFEYTGDIIGAGQDLLHLITEILEYADNQAGESELTETTFNIGELIAEVSAIAKERAGDNLIAVINLAGRHDQPQIRADRAKLRQILLNILSNGIKFNNEPGHVSIEVAQDHRGLSIIVIDDGIGMSEDQLAKASEPFTRGEEAFNRSYEGHGLGLPLAKSLIAAHGGEIGIASERGEGTTVTITLPNVRVIAPVISEDIGQALKRGIA